MLTQFLPVVHHALEQFPAQELQGSNVYIDSHIYGAGASVPVGRRTVTVPEASLLLFIDLVPAANWGHACKYLLVGTEDGKVQAFDSQFPPPRERLRVLHRGEGAEDWTLLTRSSIDE